MRGPQRVIFKSPSIQTWGGFDVVNRERAAAAHHQHLDGDVVPLISYRMENYFRGGRFHAALIIPRALL